MNAMANEAVTPCRACGATDRFPSGKCRPSTNRRNQAVDRIKYRKEGKKKWRAANLDEAKLKEKLARDRRPAETKANERAKFAAENPEYWRNYRAEHREQARAAYRRWRSANPEAAKDATNRWRARNWPLVLASAQRRRGRRKGAAGSFTLVQARARFDYYGGLCWICRAAVASCMDHVIALCNGGSNHPANLRPACRPCNSAKGAWEATGPKTAAHILSWAMTRKRQLRPTG